jgi:hypothetical protein
LIKNHGFFSKKKYDITFDLIWLTSLFLSKKSIGNIIQPELIWDEHLNIGKREK